MSDKPRRYYQWKGVSFPTPRPCPDCGRPAVKGKGEGGRPIDPDRYGHRYGYFCALRCATNFANAMLDKKYIPKT